MLSLWKAGERDILAAGVSVARPIYQPCRGISATYFNSQMDLQPVLPIILMLAWVTTPQFTHTWSHPLLHVDKSWFGDLPYFLPGLVKIYT